MFKTELKTNGSLDRYNARLVVKRYHQLLGIDFVDIFSPLVNPSKIRLLLSLVVTNGWRITITQCDIYDAFLHDNLDVYHSPESCVSST